MTSARWRLNLPELCSNPCLATEEKFFATSCYMMKKCARLTASSASALLNSIDTVLFDCDGVLWRRNTPVPGASQLVTSLSAAGKRIFYVTNNSNKSRQQYVHKCQQLGFPCKLEDIVSTSYLVAQYLSSINFSKKVYLIGPTGIADELDLVNIPHTGLGPDVLDGDPLTGELSQFTPDPDVGAVVVGFDGHFSYPKLLKAATYLSQPEVLFIATNRDERFPTESLVFPGTGTMVSSVALGSGREPLVMGKPSPRVLQAIQQQHSLTPDRTLMIGDNYQTDIVFGNDCRLRTLCVLTGVTSAEQAASMEAGEWQCDRQVADFWADSVADLITGLDGTQTV